MAKIAGKPWIQLASETGGTEKKTGRSAHDIVRYYQQEDMAKQNSNVSRNLFGKQGCTSGTEGQNSQNNAAGLGVPTEVVTRQDTAHPKVHNSNKVETTQETNSHANHTNPTVCSDDRTLDTTLDSHGKTTDTNSYNVV